VTSPQESSPANSDAAREANERGASLAHQGRFREAAAAFDEACVFDPGNADGFSNLGVVLRRLNDLDGAITQFEEAIRLRPEFAEAHYNLGNAYSALGEATLAAERYRSALTYRSNYAEAWNNLARLLNDTGHHEEALEACTEGLRHTSENPHLHNNAGNAYQGLARYPEAVREYQLAVEAAPNMSEAYSNLGLALKEVGHLDAAVQVHKKATELSPTDVGTLTNYGSALQAASETEAAIAIFERALSLDPESMAAKINLATALMDKLEVDRAIEIFEGIVDDVALGDELPEHALAHKNLGLSLLLKGEYETGIRHYAWRWETPDFTPRETSLPLWGGEDLNGEEVIVLNEQGYGDTVQFARFAQGIVARGGRPVFEAPTPLAPLIEQADNVHRVIREGETLPETGLHIPMFDLLGIFSGHVAGNAPYIVADSDKSERWTDRIPETGRKRIGLVWAGRPTHRNDRNRSIDLKAFLPLLRLTDFDFYSLQVGDRVKDISDAGLSSDLIDLSPHLNDFSDTAAALSQIDLLISVDTAAVHVAGALGRPVWALIPYAPDWRWGLEGEATVWYTSAKLWRQTDPQDWDSVIARLSEALAPSKKKKGRRKS